MRDMVTNSVTSMAYVVGKGNKKLGLAYLALAYGALWALVNVWFFTSDLIGIGWGINQSIIGLIGVLAVIYPAWWIFAMDWEDKNIEGDSV